MLYQLKIYPIFLVISLLIYWLICRNTKQRVMFIGLVSFAFLALAETCRTSILFALSSLFGLLLLSYIVFFIGKNLQSDSVLIRFFLAISAPLVVFVFYKFILPAGSHLELSHKLLIPLGISYYTFKHVHFLIESHRGQFKQANFGEYFSYIFFFPIFIAGPIERFNSFREQTQDIRFSTYNFSCGLERILLGMIKKFLLADFFLHSLRAPQDYLITEIESIPLSVALIICFVKFLEIYCDFSGYADMAIGTGLLFGIKIMENFNFPLFRSNLAEFWRAWHISLSEWARDYIYFPILIKYRATGTALIATMVVIGIWHAIKPGWALWGLHHGIGLLLLTYFHKWAKKRPRVQFIRNSRVWRVAGMFTVWWYVSMGYALTYFPATNLMTGLHLYAKILTWGVF